MSRVYIYKHCYTGKRDPTDLELVELWYTHLGNVVMMKRVGKESKKGKRKVRK